MSESIITSSINPKIIIPLKANKTLSKCLFHIYSFYHNFTKIKYLSNILYMNRRGLIMVGDFVSFWISFFIVLFIRFGWTSYKDALQTHLLPFLILFICWTLIFFIFGLYNLLSIKTTILNIKRYILAIATAFGLGIILFYFVPFFGIAPKINLVLQIGLFSITSFLSRRIIYRIFSLSITRPLIIVGQNKYLDKLHNIIKSNPQMGLNIISYLPEDKIALDNIIEKNININSLLFIFENIPKISEEAIAILYKNNVEIIDTAKAYEKYLQIIPVDYIDQKWIFSNIYPKEDTAYNIIRKIMDIIIALAILIISSPLLILAIIARIIEDGRPIFIKQQRIGKDGKIFSLHKIRSMTAIFPNGLAEENNKPKWATKNDARITRIGQILRKTHIDEIPQMINILKGNITLVGPRPEHPLFVSELEETIPHYKLRHIVKPGFTGWAQIKYRYARTEEDSKDKFEYDMYYIKNRNIFLDIGIIIKTIQIIFTH